MILYLSNGKFIESEACDLLTYEEYPQKYSYAIGQNYYPRLLYASPDEALMRSNPLTLKQLRKLKWHSVQSVNTGTMATKARLEEKHEREEREEQEKREWLRVHHPDQYNQMLYDERTGREKNARQREKDELNRKIGWITAVLHRDGHSIKLYGDSTDPDPYFRVYNVESGEFDDEGRFSENHGLFRLSELMAMLHIENGRIDGRSVFDRR